MTSSQSAVSYSDQQLRKSYQQMSREAQEMKRRRRRRFQSQVTVEEADVSYYSRSCRQLPFIMKNDGNQQMVRVQQMKRDQLLCKHALKQRESWISVDDISNDVITTNSRWEIQSQDFHDQRLDNQLQTYRYNQLEIQTQAIFIQSRATVDPVEGYSALHIHSTKNSAEAQSSSRHESAAKQFTIYESWMSTAELNSNGENDKKPEKEKDTRTIPCRSTTIGKSRVAIDPIAMHTSWRSNSDIASVTRDEGIDQLNFHSAKLGYLKLLQMSTQTQQDKAGNKYEVKPQYEELSKQLGGRHSNPVVTAPTIALDFSDTTQQSTSHNVAPNQALTTTTQTTRKAHPKAQKNQLLNLRNETSNSRTSRAFGISQLVAPSFQIIDETSRKRSADTHSFSSIKSAEANKSIRGKALQYDTVPTYLNDAAAITSRQQLSPQNSYLLVARKLSKRRRIYKTKRRHFSTLLHKCAC
ncbi:hypothetical protein F511_18508 [Dorcoceras hygrometricum]|uniref:Uncharacterized protein n=1 Tax=Dorcoceras hygrometricum TaxID=472368 RepID=A0A2Z7AM16_9LAMI|nr:hypothetical protein F511_18508 [Dorcoceras hygrometricum]